MSSIEEDFRNILKVQSSMGYKMESFLDEGLSKEQLAEIEDDFCIKLNKELKLLYSFQNGLKSKGQRLGEIGILPTYYFFKIEEAIRYNDDFDWEEFLEFHEASIGVGISFFPFLHDNAGDCYWVNLNDKSIDYGKIYWTNTLGSEPRYVFHSLSDFFQILSGAYQEGYFNVEDNGYLNLDQKKWDNLCKSHFLNDKE